MNELNTGLRKGKCGNFLWYYKILFVCLWKIDSMQLDFKTLNLSLPILNGTTEYWNSISQIK